MTNDVWFYAVGALAAFLVGTSKGGLPMVGVLGVPIMALVMPPVAAAATLLPVYIVSDVVGLWAYRKHYDKRNMVILLPALIFGVCIGWATANITPQWIVTLLVGLIGLAYCINAVMKRSNTTARPADVPRGLFWGTVAGSTSFVSHTGGPPVQMYMLPQRLDKMVFAGTITITFAIVNALKLIPYWALGEFNPGNLQLAAYLSPVAVAGAIIGYKLTSVIPQKLFFQLIEIALAVVSIKLIFDALFK